MNEGRKEGRKKGRKEGKKERKQIHRVTKVGKALETVKLVLKF